MSTDCNDPIQFNIGKIETLQFAILQEDVNESYLALQAGFGFGIDDDSKVIQCTFEYIFLSEEKQVLKIESAVQFSIESECFHKQIEQKDAWKIPKEFATHIAMTTVSVTRGILHEKTRNSILNNYPMPVINVTEAVQNDIVIERSKPGNV